MKRFLIFLIAFILLTLTAFMLLRGYFLEQALNKIQQKVSDKYQARLSIAGYSFEGIARIALDQVALTSPAGDTLFSCKKTIVSVSLMRFLKGQPPINNIVAATGYVRLKEFADSTNNYSFLLKSGGSKTDTLKKADINGNYEKLVRQLWKRFFDIADLNLSIHDFLLSWQTPDYNENLMISELTLNKSVLKFRAVDSLTDRKVEWEINGIIDHSEEIITFSGSTTSSASEEIPFLYKISGMRCFMNKFELSVSTQNTLKAGIGFNIDALALVPGIHHWRISPDEVKLDSLHVRLNIIINKNEIQSGPETVFIINQLPIITDFSYEKNDSTLISLLINIEEMPAQIFFNSLPKGLFTTLEGIKVKGNLSYHLIFKANFKNPENLVFETGLKKSEFQITGYGAENFAAINSSFSHVVREKDVVIRTIRVGSENPKYVPLELISPLLINSVLTAEDGTFRFHKGFNEEAFRQSMATNIKEKRFARGGSTITMQLVKNVFLHRNKTVSRKVEEALIVWLIENNRLVSKDRILEVYLNIIEWGPGIYGIGEAAEFYFAKHPAALTLEESIYLSSIIPRPKTFRYTFDKEGIMKDYLKGYFDLVAGRLLKKEIITQQMRDSLHYNVELKGRALQMVVPTDSIPADSLLIDDPEVLF